MSSEPWVRKYFPNNSKGIVGNKKVVQRLLEFVQDYKKQKKKAVLLVGGTGVGKTASVYAVAAELNYELLEINSSQVMNADSVKNVIGNAANTMSLTGRGKIILIDDVDAFSGRKDRGGISEIIDVIKKSGNPIILTALNQWNQKLRTLKNHAEVLQFRKLMKSQIKVLLKLIADSEELCLEQGVIELVAEKSGGDMRAAITDLEVLTTGGKVLQQDVETLGYREKTLGVFEVLDKMFHSQDYHEIVKAVRNSDVNLDELLLWVAENLPRRVKDRDSLIKAYETLAEADLFRARIRKRQHWRFLVYVQDLLVLAVMLAEKDRGWFRTERPSKIAKLWKTKSERNVRASISAAFAENCHTSARQAEKIYLPFLKTLSLVNWKKASELCASLKLGEKEVEWLKNST